MKAYTNPSDPMVGVLLTTGESDASADEAPSQSLFPLFSDCRLHLYGHVAHCLVQFPVVNGQHDASLHGGIFLGVLVLQVP